MSLRALQRQWTILGERDPYWAILTAPGKQDNRWDVDEFFSTGVWEISGVMDYLETHHPLPSKKFALDFGCGAGRLTQALAAHFDSVTGIDISAPMIDLARRHNRFPDRCEYVLNQREDLRALPSARYDFVYSNITLQHMHPRLGRGYLRELVRLLAPGGALLFQLPTSIRGGEGNRMGRALEFGYRHFWWLFRRPKPFLEMHGHSRPSVVKLLEQSGARVVDVRENENAGPDWHSLSYLVTRP